MASLNWRSINYHCNKRRNSNEKEYLQKSLLVSDVFCCRLRSSTKDITVTANVDAALDMTQTDNTALPKAVMQYLPESEVCNLTVNDQNLVAGITKDVKMQLVSQHPTGSKHGR